MDEIDRTKAIVEFDVDERGTPLPTGRFLEDASGVDGVHVVIVEVPRTPDALRERYTGDEKDPFRPATPDEMAAAADAMKGARADQVLESRELRALLIAAVWSATGKRPDDTESAQALDYWRQAYKALL